MNKSAQLCLLATITLYQTVESKGQKIGSMAGVLAQERQPTVAGDTKQQIDFSSSFLDQDTLASDLNEIKKELKTPKNSSENDSLAAQLDAYLLKYDAYQDNRKNSDVIYDVKRVEAKQEQDRQKRIQFIKDMAAVTIYVFLGFGVLFLLYKGFRRYQGTAPIFVKNQEADQVTEIEMNNSQFNLSRAKAA